MAEKQQLKFHIGFERAKQISRWTEKVEISLNKLYRNRSLRALKDWYADMFTLFQSIRNYCGEDTIEKIRELAKPINEAIRKEDIESIEFDKIDELHSKVQDARINDAGMDIPIKRIYEYGKSKKEIDK